MTQGVEHLIDPVDQLTGLPVKLSLMPQGVEHLGTHSGDAVRRHRETIFDAARR